MPPFPQQKRGKRAERRGDGAGDVGSQVASPDKLEDALKTEFRINGEASSSVSVSHIRHVAAVNEDTSP